MAISARTFSTLAAVAMAIACLGCGNGSGDSGRADSGRPQVLATVLPVYALALDVAGPKPGVELSLLMPAGAGCPHDYTFSPGDLAKLARARVLLANGAGLEPFLEDGSLKAVNPGLRVVDLSAGLDLLPRRGAGSAPDRTEEPVPCADGCDHQHQQHHAGAFNGHVFASPRSAAAMVRSIAEALAALDPQGAGTYRANAERVAGELLALADEMADAARSFPNRKVVAMHDVFDYLARDAGLEVVAIIEEEPGQEPGLGTFSNLVRQVRADKPAVIFSEPQYSDRPAQALSRETGVPVICLDPFATGRAEAGAYLATMRRNLETMKKALGTSP
jgi:ABC-type Zn uptake system ZnuABC Zn-binding protein ZnuA